MKKVTKADILNIKPGEFEVFVLDTPKAVVSAKSYALQIGHIEPPAGVGRYRTKCNYKDRTIVIEAVPSE